MDGKAIRKLVWAKMTIGLDRLSWGIGQRAKPYECTAKQWVC